MDDKTLILALLQDQVLAYRPMLARCFGGVCAGVMLSQLLYWDGKQADPDGWIMKPTQELTDETALTPYEIESARGALVKSGAIEYARKGMPARSCYRLRHTIVIDKLQEFMSAQPVKTRPTKTVKPLDEDTIKRARANRPKAPVLDPVEENTKRQAQREPWAMFLVDVVMSDTERKLAYDLARLFGFTDDLIGAGTKGKTYTFKREQWATVKNLMTIAKGDDAFIRQVAQGYYDGPHQQGYAFQSPDSLRNTLVLAQARRNAQDNDDHEIESPDDQSTDFVEVQTPLGIIFESK